MSETLLAALVGVLGVVLGAVISGAFQRSKGKAEISKIVAETCISLIEPLNKRVDDLEVELADWKDWAERLVDQIEKLGHKPVPFKQPKEK